MDNDRKIRVGISHGDINGISYEIIAGILADDRICELCTPVVFGSGKVAGYYRKMLNLDEVRYHTVSTAEAVKDGSINMVNVSAQELKVEPGVATAESGHAAMLALDMATDALMEGHIDVLVTAPINKAAMRMAGFDYPGHTEYLEARLGGKATMMFTDGNDLRVALLTTHLPVAEVAGSVNRDTLLAKLGDMDAALRRDFGMTRPLIAVLSLNPHAGDGGVIGNEEAEIISPAIEVAASQGIMVSGPYPADGFFGSGAWKKFDAVLAMYHDQGLVAFKALSGTGGVNYTAGLPYVRTSPDHGTGYDIVGKGIADPTSLRQAIYTAIDIYRSRERYEEAHANPLKHYAADKTDRRRQTKTIKEEKAAVADGDTPSDPDTQQQCITE